MRECLFYEVDAAEVHDIDGVEGIAVHVGAHAHKIAGILHIDGGCLVGKDAGGAWTFPYRVNITPYIKRGVNTIEVEVVNNWQNRIIGDMRLPEKDRKVWMTVNPWSAESPLQPSGLIGPVRIVSYML